MGVRKNSFVVNSIISHFPVKWEVFLLNFFKRQSWNTCNYSWKEDSKKEI